MEGPSLVIATEELKPFNKKKILASNRPEFIGKTFKTSESWGKHLILHFTKVTLRIHFLMFGSYRIDDPRENRIPKLELEFKGHKVYFYSCAIKEISKEDVLAYDHEINAMSSQFSKARAARTITALPNAFVCDILMDQTIFAGVGNIIKNEVLWNLRLHPETKVGALSKPEVKKLVQETVSYCHQFYAWKKALVLKSNWKIFRKRKCPECGGAVTKKPTGKLARLSHFCPKCQKKLS